MVSDEQAEWLVPTTGAKTLPVIEVLTGRGFITGKSGSGKSNTASVIAEELLDSNYNLLIVDPEGEYYGLKERYEVLHVGNDELCDVQVTPDHAEQLAEIALEQNMPIILDVSDYLDADEASELIANVVRELFRKEKDARKPFLLMIEEMQEYLPQQGGQDELSELLERVAKRGRKRGLGMLGMSQRPSSVDKDFITQCDWMVWHRLTWQNDIDVVRKVLGSEIADEVEDLDTGEGYLMTDWDESVERVQFKRKRTHDAGATPGLESYERPDLKSVSADLIADIKDGAGGPTPADTAPELDPADQAELSEAVETVEVRGVPDGVEDASGNGQSTTERADDGVGDIDGGAGGDGGDATGGMEERAVDDLETGVDTLDPSGVDLDALDEGELRDHVRSLRRQNRILDDEVTELRTILKSVENRQQQRQAQGQAQGTGRGQRQGQGTSSSRSGHGRSAGDASGSGSGRPPAPSVSRPRPPEPPIERSGVAGNLVEFVEMTGYVTRSLFYRCRLLGYKLRYYGRSEAEQQGDQPGNQQPDGRSNTN